MRKIHFLLIQISIACLLILKPYLSRAELPEELRAPIITVDTLFSELLIMNTEHESYHGWTPVGLGELIKLSRDASLMHELSTISSKKIWVEVPHFNSKPILYEKEKDHIGFFSSIHQEIPSNSSYITYQYIFFPQSVTDERYVSVSPDKREDMPHSVSFFLVKKVSSNVDQEHREPIPNQKTWKHFIRENVTKYELYLMGDKAIHSKPAQAEALLKESASYAHSPEANYMLGWIYYHGAGRVAQDLTQAKTRFELASEEGHAPAKRMLAKMLRFGQGSSKKHPKKARRLLSEAAKAGIMEAKVELAEMKYLGEGMTEDKEGAIQSLKELTAEDSSGFVEWRIGTLYLRTGNVQQAEEHLLKAAQKEYWEAYYSLGVLYHQKGEAKKAKKYFQLALDSDYPVKEKLGSKLFKEYKLKTPITSQ